LNYKAENSLCYGEIQANCNKYGRLYDWETAIEVCPDGWHLPSNDEWAKLYSYVGGSETAGKYLKSKIGWVNSLILEPLGILMALLLGGENLSSFSDYCDFFKFIFSELLKHSNGEDTFGFSALPGGYALDSRFGHYDFIGVRESAHWWTSSLKNVQDGDDAYSHGMYSNEEDASHSNSSKDYFYSVRCLQGTPPKTEKPPNDTICAQKSPDVRVALAQQKGTLTDTRDGKKYKTIKIGEQVWMAENLNHNASGSKCYGNKLANCCEYGRLYNWKTAMAVCPSGWHLPSKEEWDILYRYVEDGKSDNSTPYEIYSETAGKFLKATNGWKDHEGKSGNGEDKFGFSALPGGGGHPGSRFRDVGEKGLWWSSSDDERENYFAYCHGIYNSIDKAHSATMYKDILYSVRCVQDSILR